MAYFMSRGVGDVAAVPEKVAKVLAGTASALGGAAIQTTEVLLQPLSEGAGNMLGAIAGRISTKQKDLAALRSKVLTLTQEVEALKARRISIDRTKSILQLALIEAEFTRHNIKKTLVNKKLGNFLERDEETEYLGIIKATYKQRLGVDLEKLSFQIAQSSPSTVGLPRKNGQ